MNELKATLQTKNGMYYCVISYKDKEQNKWKLKWKTTKVLAKQGNKKKAKDTFPAIIENFRKELEEKENKQVIENSSYEQRIEENKNKTFLEFIKESIEEFQSHIELTTYLNWLDIFNRRISNYFGVYKELKKIYNEDIERPKYYKKELKIAEVTQFDIEDFYTWLYKCGLKGSSVLKYHVLLSLCFSRSIRLKIFTLETNPMKDVPKPSVDPYTADYYTANELSQLFEVMKGEKIEIPVILAAYYGLRRSEVLGLRISAINWENKFIKINHTVTRVVGRGENQKIYSKDATKNDDIRTLPLIPEVEQKLREHLQKVEQNKKFYGNAYVKVAEEYICVNEIGELIRPDYITSNFGKILKANNLRHLKFHRT